MNYAIFLKFCDRMQFEVNCAKSHHCVIYQMACKEKRKQTKAESMIHYCIYLGKNGRIDIEKWDWFIIIFTHAKIYKLKHGTMG